MVAAADEQQVAVIAEVAAAARILGRAADLRRVVVGDDAGALLVELQEIPAVPVEKREVRGDDDLLRVYAAMRGDGRRAVERRDERVVINAQPFGRRVEKPQRVKLRHVRIDHGVRDRQWQLRVGRVHGVKAEFVQQLGLLPQMILPGQRVHDRGARLERAVDVLRQRAKLCQRVQIRAQVLLRTLHAV